jgi:hypothetical protein
LKDVEEKQVKQEKKWEQERLAEEQFRMKIAAGEEAAFIPSSNALLTRKLKKFGAYEVIREENDYGQQVAGLTVLEKDLLATLSEVGEPTEPVSRLLVILNYAWLVNADAKGTSYLSRKYRYMKKGYLLDELSRLAAKQQRFTWGWKKDPHPPANGAEWVLYFECDGMQCSFHTFEQGVGPEFPKEWDEQEHQTFPFAAYLAEGRPPLFEIKTGRKNSRQTSRRRR